MTELLYYARGVHFAATFMVAGIVFFAVFVAEPAFCQATKESRIAALLRHRLAWIAWVSLALCLLSGATWLLFTAASMSGQPLAQVYSQDVLWTVLSQTDFGNDWLARFVCGCVLAALCVPLLSASEAKSFWLQAAAVIAAACFTGSLAWAGHANGAQGLEGIVHPAADFLHLVAAAAWVGALVPLAMLLSLSGDNADALAIARTTTSRFSTLGIVCVATLLITGSLNTWYLVGSVPALTESAYGRLLLIKLALFLVMVGIAAFNWSQLTPRLVRSANGAAAQRPLRGLCRNAAIEALFGASIIGIVAVLGTLPPASHAAHHHEIEEAVPSDASFQHIHSEHGMADVIIEPGRVGTARVTIHLLDDDLETLPAQAVTLTLTAPNAATKPITRTALQEADGQWHINGVTLAEPGNWIVTVDVLLGPDSRLQLVAPIVIDPKK